MAAGARLDYERDKDDPLRFAWQMRQENDEFLRRQRWWWIHYQNGTLKNKRQIEAEQVVDELVRQMGYRTRTTTHKCPFDLWVQDEAGRAVKVEIKISRYNQLKKGSGRYQCDVRHHDQADLLVFIARNGQDWPFVIPMSHIAPRRNIAIWSFHPEAYGGQWARYLKAWEYLHQAIESATRCARPWQLRLF